MIYTAQQKLEALERELRYRLYVFPSRVTAQRMTQQKADYEIGIMRAMIEDYRPLAEKERLL